MSRRLLASALVASMAPIVLGVAFVRPAGAGVEPYTSFGITGIAAAVRTEGDAGVGGGLARLDSGIGFVSAALDSAPSADVLSAPVEPGTLPRTVAGQVGQAQQIPDAEAQYPGGKGTEVLTTVPKLENGILDALAGSATAKATRNSAAGTALGVSAIIAGLLDVEGATSSVELKSDGPNARLSASARANVGKITIAGVLELDGVTATASLSADGTKHVPKANFVLGGAKVAGQPIGITSEGVEILGAAALSAQTLRDATATVNGVLSAAGITIRTVGKTESATKESALADSGGLSISIITPALPGGIPGNSLDLIVGGVSLTEAASQPQATTPTEPVQSPATNEPLPDVGGEVVTTPDGPDVTAPQVDPLAPTVPSNSGGGESQLVVAGHPFRASLAIVAFVAWQVFTLGTAVTCGVLQRRRPDGEGEVL